jgi:hypothetical protein
MSKESGDNAQLPSLASILLEYPLYSVIPKSDGFGPLMKSMRHDGFQFDAHCVYCKSSSTFKASKSSLNADTAYKIEAALKNGFFDISSYCTRHGHIYTYNFLLWNDGLQKTGQYPSLEDVAGADIEKYRSQLKGGAFQELRRATGLASHGIGIGAFVYLRRIFERLIYEHRDEAQKASGPIEGFDGLRMEEKIAALKEVLPKAIVKHRAAYSILSKGLHELTEDECKLYFPAVRAAIIQMLEQDWQAREAQRAELALEKELQSIAGKIKGPPTVPKA